MRTLVVTNDFPPRPGGIQAFVAALASRQPEGEVVVYAPAWKGAPAFDAAQGFPVVRHPGTLMLPGPSVLRRAREIALEVAPDLHIGHAVAEGSPIDMLLEMSKECTMVVMGSRGLSGISGMVLGSVSGAVVSHASCPVVVMPPRISGEPPSLLSRAAGAVGRNVLAAAGTAGRPGYQRPTSR